MCYLQLALYLVGLHRSSWLHNLAPHEPFPSKQGGRAACQKLLAASTLRKRACAGVVLDPRRFRLSPGRLLGSSSIPPPPPPFSFSGFQTSICFCSGSSHDHEFISATLP